MTPEPLDLDAIAEQWSFVSHDGDRARFAEQYVGALIAEVARLRSVGEDDIAAWAEYVTGKKWAPVAIEEQT